MPRSNLTIPLAIIIAGLLIGGALLLIKSNNARDSGTSALQNGLEQKKEQRPSPITSSDHILGNPQAPIKLIEYSDTECPFCKRFHETMHRIIDDYGKNGEVAWVYRHFPLAQLHSKAPKEAAAAECAAEIGGNSGFWKYIDKIYSITPSNDNLDLMLLPQIAEDIKLDRGRFEECLASGRHEDKVQAHFDEARRLGAGGTPFTVLVFGESVIKLEGAQPYESIKRIIDEILTQSALLKNIPVTSDETEDGQD